MRTVRNLLLGSLALAGATFAGCAQQVGDIDRTSPNKVAKADLAGEWYMIQTVIDTNALALSSFPGLQGNLHRVFFDIEEDVLVVRRTYEDVPGTDTAGSFLPDGASWDGGTPVAAFPIQGHFTVQRQYNSSTGEQTNVISENSSDRNWYDNDTMRVDWSRQTINDGWDSIIGIQMMSSVAVGPQDEGPETTWFIDRNEDGEAVYLDVVNTYYVMPDIIECILNFGVPAWGADCGPERVSVRSSYRKITEESDYIARDFSEFDMNRFGYFTTTRCVFDRRYECVDDSLTQAAAVWNIWQRHTDGNGNVLPYAERTPQPISYYLNTEWPLDLIGPAYESTEQWSFAFRRTVAALQGRSIDEVPRMFYACFNTGTAEEAQVVLDFADTMRNPVRAQLLREAVAASQDGYANGACADQGIPKNIGDLRYSALNWVNNGPWIPWGGYGPSGQDPLTGQTVQGAANMNGANYDWAAQRTLEIVKVINGELTPEELGYGDYISEYFDALREQTDNDRYFGYLLRYNPNAEGEDAQQKSLLATQALSRRAAEITSRAERFEHLTNVGQDVLRRPHVQQLMQRPITDFQQRNAAQVAPMRRLVGTPMEQALILPEVEEGLGRMMRDAGMSEEEVLNYISPARIANAETFMEYGDRLRSRLLDRNIHMGSDFDPYMLGFAREISTYRDELIAAGMTPGPELDTELWIEIRAVISRGVIEHEIGHTVGLRHNFEGSTDAMNYHPEYWALRNRTIDEDCDAQGWSTFNPEGLSTGEVAPRGCGSESAAGYAERSALLLEELRLGIVDADTTYSGGIHEYAYASIMDYDAKVNTHSSGLGLYDYAAIAYGYGNLVEVFNNDPYRIDVRSTYDDRTDDFTSITVERSAQRVVTMDDVDNYFVRRNGINSEDLPPAADRADRGDSLRDHRWTHWHYSILPMMFDGIVNEVDSNNVAAAYYPPLKDFEGIDRMAAMYDRSLVPLDQAEGEVRVPYRFCEDYRRGASSTCRWSDHGADEYEALTELMNTYESYYVTSFFRRQRRGFGLWLYPVISSMLGRYYGTAVSYYQYWLLNFSSRGFDWLNSEYGGLQQYNAALESVNFVGRAFSTPSVGTYVFDEETNTYLNVSDETDFRFDSFDPTYPGLTENDYLSVSIADGARFGFGRYAQNDDGERPYHYFLNTEILSHFWAKYAALFAITSGSVDVVGVDTSSDSSSFFIPPYLVFEEDMTNFFGAMLTEDFNDIGWCVRTVDGRTVAEPQDLIRGNNDEGCTLGGGTPLNPFTAVYGNRDYNMQYLSPVMATANFDSTLDTDWFDNAGIYIYGTGDQPEIFTPEGEEANFEWITFTDDSGTTYASKAPAGYDPTDRSSANTRVGYEMIQRLVDLRVERDVACPFQFVNAASDLSRWCGMDRAEAQAYIEEYEDTNGAYEGRDFFEINNDLDSSREIARHVARTMSYFNLIDGEMTW